MGDSTGSKSSTIHVPLHIRVPLSRTSANRVFAFFYSLAILALLYHRCIALLQSFTIVSLLILMADAVLAFMWATSQAFRMCPVGRRVFIEHLEHYAKESDYPRLDVFVCTSDPYKEPPMCAVNTALSVMSYDYPTEKLSVYVSDDGGSKLTLFAFMEAARFAALWLPYCKKNKIVERCPEAYFRSNLSWFPETDQIKMMYENMRDRVEKAVQKGSICHDYITNEGEGEAFSRWTDGFTPQNHPPVIQVLLESSKDKDNASHTMPNLVYISRGKSTTLPHHFKAGALNVLLRVSGTMSNAPVILTLDTDMYSNDPQTPLRVLCYLLDPAMDPKLGRGVFFGGPLETPELNQDHLVNKSINSKEVLAMAHHVADCNFEKQTKWGTEIGFRYGSLAEDFYTGYLLKCKGWKSIFCNPKRPAFLGNSPINLHSTLNQLMRWSVGLLEVAFCRYSPITFGVKSINPLTGLCYAHYAFWPIWSIPITIYAFVPQLSLLNCASIFPKASDPWFLLYIFLFLGAYGQECLEFMLAGETIQRWWNNQRMWTIRGLSSLIFGLVEYLLKFIGISTFGFNVTSKVIEEEQRKRYNQGIFEFGVPSPLFLPMTTAAVINLVSFLWGIVQVFKQRELEGLFTQMLLAGFAIVNCWPLYEAMVLRTDEGKMPVKITLISITLAWALYLVSSIAF
ncbi:cellulose synthase-like protein G3 isoform X2 [Vitis riparia]|uniref:cellulose synthase-like protein G3 isoform X2 n=1 Tax=Vitis riparia TaxID=96939 RepID=UPI00155AFCDF|nr:cellulose synthase-like protein G3 isoform X2 [Vitis riparia]